MPPSVVIKVLMIVNQNNIKEATKMAPSGYTENFQMILLNLWSSVVSIVSADSFFPPMDGLVRELVLYRIFSIEFYSTLKFDLSHQSRDHF